MKKKVWLSLAIIAAGLIGCTQTANRNITYRHLGMLPVDSANKMLSSYLNSVHYQQNDSATQSISFDANLLRMYLDSLPVSASIVSIKIMFAHKLSYINAGHADQYAGYNDSALTLIISGYDDKGNYILLPDNESLDHGVSCPKNCPLGSAANPLIPTLNATP